MISRNYFLTLTSIGAGIDYLRSTALSVQHVKCVCLPTLVGLSITAFTGVELSAAHGVCFFGVRIARTGESWRVILSEDLVEINFRNFQIWSEC